MKDHHNLQNPPEDLRFPAHLIKPPGFTIFRDHRDCALPPEPRPTGTCEVMTCMGRYSLGPDFSSALEISMALSAFLGNDGLNSGMGVMLEGLQVTTAVCPLCPT